MPAWSGLSVTESEYKLGDIVVPSELARAGWDGEQSYNQYLARQTPGCITTREQLSTK